MRGLAELAGVEIDLAGRDEGVEDARHERDLRLRRRRRDRDGPRVAVRRFCRLRLRDLADRSPLPLAGFDLALVAGSLPERGSLFRPHLEGLAGAAHDGCDLLALLGRADGCDLD